MATLLITQYLTYGVSWLIVVSLLKSARLPALLWSLHCLVLALAFYEMAEAPDKSLGVLAPLPAITLLVAYLFANLGIDRFAHGRVRFLGLWLGLFVATAAVQFAGAQAEWPTPWRSVAYNLSLWLFLVLPLWTVGQAVVAEFGRLGLLALAPGATYAALVALRTVMIILDPSLIAPRPIDPNSNPGLTISSVIGTGLFNVAFLGMVIGRLVLQLERSAQVDPLTGLANRGKIQSDIDTAWDHHLRSPSPLSLAFIDLDHFKAVNDRFGHASGDRVLREFAALLQENSRGTDLVGRWGGEEFVVVMPHTPTPVCRSAMERLQQRLRERSVVGVGLDLKLTLSIGIASGEPREGAVNDFIERADAAMYQAKQAGRDRIVETEGSLPSEPRIQEGRRVAIDSGAAGA